MTDAPRVRKKEPAAPPLRCLLCPVVADPSASSLAPAAPRHRRFSPGRVWALATTTLTELVRLKVFYFVLIFAAVLIAAPLVFPSLVFHDQFQMLRDVALGAMSIFTSLLAILATAGLLPKDTEDRTLYTILAKPVSRLEYLLGKFLGVALLLALAAALMAGIFGLVLVGRHHVVEVETRRTATANGLPPGEVAAPVRDLRATAFTPGLPAAALVILAKACLLAAMTLAVSTFASSTLFTVLVAATAYFVGHFEATAREYWLNSPGGEQPAVKLLLGLLVLVFPDLQLFNVVDEAVAGVALPLALLWRTLGLGGLYCAIYLLAAYFIFAGKEL